MWELAKVRASPKPRGDGREKLRDWGLGLVGEEEEEEENAIAIWIADAAVVVATDRRREAIAFIFEPFTFTKSQPFYL